MTLILPRANFTERSMMRIADGHDAVHAALDLQLDQAVECGFVHLAVFERRDNRSVSAGKHNQFALKSAKTARLASRKLGNDLKRACPVGAACLISLLG